MIKMNELRDFLKEHPTFWDRLAIPDTHFSDRFNHDVTFKDKQAMYSHYRRSLNRLLDYMEIMPHPDYDVALYQIKCTDKCYCLPIRIKGWGWKEPVTVDELEDYLRSLYDKWNLVMDRSYERLSAVHERRKIIQSKLL